MSSELENIRQLVAKLDEVQIDLETVKEGLDKNFENYKNISDISSDISEKNQEVLESINTLQIQATQTVETAIEKATNLKIQMGKYYSAEYSQTKKDLDTLLSNMESELSTLKSTIKTTIQSAVNDVNIDTSALSNIIDKKIGNLDFTELNNIITSTNEKVNSVIAGFEKSGTNLDLTTQTLIGKTEEINDAIENINSANKSLSMAMTLGMLAFGAVVGFGTATYFKIDAISDNYFSNYEKKQTKLEADQKEIINKLKNLDKVSTLLFKNGNKISYGTYNNSDVVYIEIKNVYSDKTEYTFTRNGSALIGLKNRAIPRQ